MRRLIALALITGCATFGTQGERLSALEADALSCDDFGEFDARAKAAALIDVNNRVNEALKTCARTLVQALLSIRETRGAEAVQQQLDVLALAFSERTFIELTEEVAVDPNVRAMVALAAATAATSRAHHAQAAPEGAALESWSVDAPRAPPGWATEAPTSIENVRQCESLGSDGALNCLTELATGLVDSTERASLEAAILRTVTRHLQRLDLLPPVQQARPLAKLLARLAPLGVEAPEAWQRFERSHAAAWPEVVALEQRGRVEQAAVRAEPFEVLPTARAQVQRLRRVAFARQFERVAQAGTRRWAAALHRHWAARFEAGVAAGWPDSTGQWDTSRFVCPHPVGPLPSAAGLQLRLTAKCTRAQRVSDGVQPANPALQTFEAERSLEWENINGTLFASCAGQVFSYRVSSHDLALETQTSALGIEGAARSALSIELEKLVKRAAARCRAARAQLVDQACVALSGEPLDVEERFVEHAVALQQWPPCFKRWVEAVVGLELPSLN